MTRARISVLVLLAILALGGAALATGASAGGVATTNAVKSLSGCGTTELGRIDDTPSGTATLPFTINFFGANYTTVYVNNNGNVTFDGPLSQFTPENIVTTSHVIIAPYFADVDTRGAGSGVTTYGATTFGGRPAFCVTWPHVGYFGENDDKLNTFQLLLVDRGDVVPGDFDIIFNYDSIQWETGDFSGGSNGLGGHSARAGYSNGSTTSFELPGSAVNGAFLDSSPGGLANNSRASLERGRYIFPVRNGAAPVGGSISGTITGDLGSGNVPLAGAPVQACFTATPPRPCDLTTTNSLGRYIFTGLPGGGNYFITAFPPSGVVNLGPRTIGAIFLDNNAVLTGRDIKLVPSVPVPPNVVIHTPYRAGDGTPAISSSTGASFEQTNACTRAAGTWTLVMNGVIIGSGPMIEGPAGTYTGTIPPLAPNRGRASLTIVIDCPGSGDKNDTFDVYIDPSGNVLDQNDNPVDGATVTLYRSDSAAGPFDVLPSGAGTMSPSNRTNPDMTGGDGGFHWDVLAGYYKVRAQKQGCVNPNNASQAYAETMVLQIPPPALNLVIRLQCGGGPANTPTRTPTRGGPTRTPTPRPSADVGDVNKNGRVDSIDASIVLQYTAGFLDTINDTADANEDGLVTSVDATLILQFGAGLIHSLPV